MIDTGNIRANGWRQCAVFPADATDVIAGQMDVTLTVADSRWLVISHSCDINSPSQSEIDIEVILITPLEKEDKLYIRGRHPRRYHLNVSNRGTGANDWYEARIDKRFCVDRGFCSTYAPCSDIFVSKDNVRTIIQWVTYRYVRSVFPDKFNARIKPVRDKLKQILGQDESKLISGLFVNLSPNVELPDSDNYDVELLAVFDESITSNRERSAAQQLVDEFAAILASCRKINVSHECLRKSEVSLATIEQFQRFTDYDYLSYEESET